MQRPILLIASILSIIAIINPIFVKPISSFFSQYIFFVSFIFFIISFSLKQTKLNLFFSNCVYFYVLFIIFISISILENSLYFPIIFICSFLIAMIIGFNQINYSQVMIFLTHLFLISGLLSAICAYIQWLGFSNDQSYLLNLIGNRPYANFAQPNHLATFLFLSFISLYYLYEKEKLNPILTILFFVILIWGVVLTQSRTSWLVITFIPLFILFKSKKINFRISKLQLFSLVACFWLMVISLPYVNQFLSAYFNIAQSSSLIERATTGHLRLNIWNQMIHAIWEKPWLGYGWGQTTAAQYAVVDRYPGTEWASSAHNVVLDILVWCGIPIGLSIVLYFAYLYWDFLTKSKSIETICATLMISAVLIHAMLEYPLHYAYFLLPVGFLCGICLAEQNVRTIEISSKWGYLIVIIGFITLYQVFKEYDQITDNMVAANTHEMNELKTELELPYDSIFFDKYEDRAKWIAQYPYMKVNQNILDLAERNLKSFLTSYDLYKYAVLLAHNGQKEKAERQLRILKIMYNEDHQYSELFVKTPSVNVPLENTNVLR